MFSWLEMGNEPMVIETPPNVLGFINDHWFRYVIDFGNLGPDEGKGGKFLVLPPGYKGEVPEGEYLLPIGVADIKRKGKDVTIISFGKMVKVALEAAEEMAKEGIDCEVIDLRTVRPIDYATCLESVKKTNRAVIVEEANPIAGISSELTYHFQRYAFDYLDAPVIRVNSMDIPLSYSASYIDVTLPNVKRTIDAIKKVTYK
jgi:pyruvate dehydrogenase E1 component beta subunit